MFAGPVTAIGEAQLKTWLIEWDRPLKTKANYHGLIYGGFAYAVKRGYLAANPAIGTAPKRSRVKQSRPELRFLTERELETAVRLAKRHGDVLAVTAGTGLRFGEISALWVGDIDLDRGTVRVNKACKRNGEDDATEIPGWLSPAVAGEAHDAGSPPRASEDTAIPTDHHDRPGRGRAAREAD
ncbi:MAG TPA: hypothetical protein VF086_05680 [Propionibacteriaceae bacterium]